MAVQLRSAQRRFDLLRSTAVRQRSPQQRLIVVSAEYQHRGLTKTLGICVDTSLDLVESPTRITTTNYPVDRSTLQ
jgi:hypothetical protein